MKYEPVKLFDESEYSYSMAFGFRPDVVPYIHENDTVRPCVLVVPGGGYAMVAPSEGELVADRFYEAGYQTFVLTYSTNLFCAEPLRELPLRELARAIRFIRARAGEYRVNPGRLVLCGFSAGAHLCGSVCVHWEDAEDTNPAYKDISARPDAAILSYPVITSGEHAHQDSFRHLLGQDIYDRQDGEARELLDYWSLEKHVTDKTPPVFLWQTITDELVPVENSLLMAGALQEHGVPHALHLFSYGRHGLSLADDRWAEHRYGDSHCANIMGYLVNAVRSGELPLPEETKKAFEDLSHMSLENMPKDEPSEEVRVWPELALTWLDRMLNGKGD